MKIEQFVITRKEKDKTSYKNRVDWTENKQQATQYAEEDAQSVVRNLERMHRGEGFTFDYQVTH